MRASLALLGVCFPLSASAINVFDWFSKSPESVSVSNQVLPHKIAVIGAGPAGSSAAFWASKAKSRAGIAVEIDVYEREGYVGGRSTTVFPYDDRTLDPVEVCTTISSALIALILYLHPVAWRLYIRFREQKSLASNPRV